MKRKQMKKVHSKEEQRRISIIEKMKTVPEPTDGFVKWAKACVEKHIMYMMPFHKKKTTKATCSACHYECEYEHGGIQPKQTVSCPRCGSKCTVKRVDYENLNPIPGYHFTKEVILFQKIGKEFCERHFYLEHNVDFSRESTYITEIGRIFYPDGSTIEIGYLNAVYKKNGCAYYFNKYDPYTGNTFWDDKNLYGMANIVLSAGPVYPRTINKKMFEGTKYQYCAMELIKNEKGFEPIAYLQKYNQMPQKIEMMVKTGLLRMALEISPYEFNGTGKPWEQLGLSKEQMNRLRNVNGGRIALMWMRYEDSSKRLIDDETIRFFEKENISPENLDFILDKMSERKIMNYIIRQRQQRKRKIEDILILWRDYLSMATRIKMNVQKELIFKPKDVKQAHDDTVRLCGGTDVTKRAGEIVRKYPDIDEILQSIKNKYEYQDDQYAVVVPEKIEDIIYEGRKLGHCLDKSDIYFDRIQRRESFIVFLRKTDDVEKPYYTLEIEPNGTTRQKRTTGDRQDKDFKEAISFIQKWQREVKKRLNKSDKELAARSAELREQ